MLVNSANLDALRAGFKTQLPAGMVNTAKGLTMWTRIATRRPILRPRNRNTGWAGQVPASSASGSDRRAVQNLMQHDLRHHGEALGNLTVSVRQG